MGDMIAEAGVGGWLQGGLLVLGLLWSLVVAVLLGLRWKIPAVLAVAPLLAHAFAAALGASMAASGSTEIGMADPSQRAMLYAMGISGTLTNGTLVAAALPSALLLSLGALAAGVRGPRQFGAPIAALLCCGITALLPTLSIVWDGSVPFAAGRLALYGLATFPTALAFCGAHPRTNAREASIVAAASWTTLVAVGEMMTLANAWSHGFRAMAVIDPESKGEMLGLFLGEVAPLQTLGFVTVVASAIPMLIAFFRPDIELTEDEVLSGSISTSPVRSIGAFLAAFTPLAWLLAMWSCSPADMLASMTTAFGSEPAAAEDP